MNADRVIFNTQWIAVKESPRGFQYLERKGKDSVAVFLLRSGENPEQYEVLIRQQHLCIDNREVDGKFKLFPCPVTGALEEGELPEAAAQREVYEETGYRVQVSPLGQYIVGTQVNEICYLYYADVTGVEPDVAQQDGTYMESIARNEWHPFEYLKSCDYSACQIGYWKLMNYVSWVKDNREYLIKQSEMLQNVITRMANNSLAVKQVGLTVWAAIVGFGFTNKNSALFILAFVAFILFGVLDIYYLFQERKFRENFNGLCSIISGRAGDVEEWIEATDGNFLKPLLAKSPSTKNGTLTKKTSKLYNFPRELPNTLKSWANLPYLITLILTIALMKVPLPPNP